MNKIIIVITLSVLFQTILYAEGRQTAENILAGKADSSIITPEVGSQYNLEGMQTSDGQYKTSYSTDTVEKQKQTIDSSLKPAGVNNGLNNGVNAVPVIIVIDDQGK